MSVGSSWCERKEGVQRPSTAPPSPPVAPILGLVSFLVCFTMSTLSSHPRTSFRVVLERFPNHHWPHLSLLYFPSETKFSSFRKIESRDFPGGAVVKNPPANAGDTGLISELGRSHMPQSNEACAPWLPGSSLSRIQGVPLGWMALVREDTWDQPW